MKKLPDIPVSPTQEDVNRLRTELEKIKVECDQLRAALQLARDMFDSMDRDMASIKPDWDDEPDWSNYRAQDQDGEWYRYEVRPKPHAIGHWWFAEDGRSEYVCRGPVNGDWLESLVERPKKTLG